MSAEATSVILKIKTRDKLTPDSSNMYRQSHQGCQTFAVWTNLFDKRRFLSSPNWEKIKHQLFTLRSHKAFNFLHFLFDIQINDFYILGGLRLPNMSTTFLCMFVDRLSNPLSYLIWTFLYYEPYYLKFMSEIKKFHEAQLFITPDHPLRVDALG